MDELTRSYAQHYSNTFAAHGATAAGVDWGTAEDLSVRYDKMLAVIAHGRGPAESSPSLLDAGCGWGGLWQHAQRQGRNLRYTGIDVVPQMIDYADSNYRGANFLVGDVFDTHFAEPFDYVVCNGILTLKLAASIVEMDAYARKMIQRLYSLCRRGLAFNMMSTRVNFMAPNLHYQNPGDLLSFCLGEISPLVLMDHAYTSLGTGRGKLYEFTTYIFRPPASGQPPESAEKS
jgi:SAM-dependent methyltransferase